MVPSADIRLVQVDGPERPYTGPDRAEHGAGAWWHRVDGLEDGLVVHVLVGYEDDDYERPVITHVDIAGDAIRTEHLRKIPLGQIERRLRFEKHMSGIGYVYLVDENDEGYMPVALPPGPLTRRREDEDPMTFARRVATTYKSYAAVTGKPGKAMADDSGLPVGTVRRWIREARELGALEKGSQGRAG
jgi:hypothetical protein